MTTKEETLSWRGETLVGSDGEKLGTIDEIYLDTDTGQPEWALVSTGLFGTKQSFVPLRNASRSEGGVAVGYSKDQVKDAPRIDPDGELSHQEERELYRHYGLDWGDTSETSGSGTGTAGETGYAGGRRGGEAGYAGRERGGPGEDVSGPNTDDAMTRSEEELHVGTTERESGRVRLKKYVVEDEVTRTVPVRREEVRVEREPITDANVGDATEGPDISSEEHEVTLREEEPVAEKRAVPKERVRLDKDVTTEQREVSDTVRKEQIDVDDDAERR